MSKAFKLVLLKIKTWLNKLLIKYVDINDSNEIIKVVTKGIGISWIDMVNHVEVSNKFFIPYKLVEVKLTYYNDAQQNIGYLHFKGPVSIGPYAKKIVEMPAKMSNITALFNMVRLMVTNDIKTRTVGTTTIQLFGMKFELPVDDIMIIDKDKIVMEDEEDREKRLEEKARKDEERKKKRIEQENKRQQKMSSMSVKRAEKKAQLQARVKAQKEKMAMKREARQRLKRMKKNKMDRENQPPIEESAPASKTKEPQDNSPAAPSENNSSDL